MLFGGPEDNVLIGGAGHDMIDGDGGDDLIFGDSVFLQRRGGDDGSLLDDIASYRFQTLAGTLHVFPHRPAPSCGRPPSPTPAADC